MDELALEPKTMALLDELRHTEDLLPVYDQDPTAVECLVLDIAVPRLNQSGLKMVQFNQYCWCLRELAKLLRTRQGWSLAFELEVLLRKWHRFGLDSRLTQRLLRDACARLQSPDAELKTEDPDLQTALAKRQQSNQSGPASSPATELPKGSG
jgi:hypothetical protein